jgi:hypothetical protein
MTDDDSELTNIGISHFEQMDAYRRDFKVLWQQSIFPEVIKRGYSGNDVTRMHIACWKRWLLSKGQIPASSHPYDD